MKKHLFSSVSVVVGLVAGAGGQEIGDQYVTHSSGNDYSYQQEHIANYIWNSNRLAQHWQALSPLSMLNIPYEQLVSRPAEIREQLREFLAVPADPDPGCFPQQPDYCGHPISGKNINIAANYEGQLQPLHTTLLALRNRVSPMA